VGLLGPLLIVDDDGVERSLPARKERAVLAALALRVGRVVPPSELIANIWGDDPPRSAGKTLQTYVSALRRVLPAGVIETTGGGYRLVVPPAQVDVVNFEVLMRQGRQGREEGHYGQAVASLEQALSLWRGEPLAELADQPAGLGEAARLVELRLAGEEELSDCRLALGEHATLIGDLEQAVSAEPLRERRWAQLMVALYRCGRQADALRAYQRLRTQLGEQLGIEPSPELRTLEERVLLQDPDLAWRVPSGQVEPLEPVLVTDPGQSTPPRLVSPVRASGVPPAATGWFEGVAGHRRRRLAGLAVVMAAATVGGLLWANTSSAGGHHLTASSQTTSTSIVAFGTAPVSATTVARVVRKSTATIHTPTTRTPVVPVTAATTTVTPTTSASTKVLPLTTVPPTLPPTTLPVTVPPTTATTVPADLANCSVPEPGVLNPANEADFLQGLIGTWLLCQAPSVFGTNEVGIEIAANGQWSKLTRTSAGQLVRVIGWGNQGTWEIDAATTQPPFQVNFQINGSGTVYTEPVFSSGVPKMRLNNEGVFVADYVPTTEPIVTS
jgi:DNA-binding SARP family transcriptional activator